LQSAGLRFSAQLGARKQDTSLSPYADELQRRQSRMRGRNSWIKLGINIPLNNIPSAANKILSAPLKTFALLDSFFFKFCLATNP